MCSNEPDSSIGSQENSCKCKTSTDLKIDWIWHLLLKIEAGVIGPTLLYFSIQNHVFRVFIPFTPF